jgi:hypothetical protein
MLDKIIEYIETGKYVGVDNSHIEGAYKPCMYGSVDELYNIEETKI